MIIACLIHKFCHLKFCNKKILVLNAGANRNSACRRLNIKCVCRYIFSHYIYIFICFLFTHAVKNGENAWLFWKLMELIKCQNVFLLSCNSFFLIICRTTLYFPLNNFYIRRMKIFLFTKILFLNSVIPF